MDAGCGAAARPAVLVLRSFAAALAKAQPAALHCVIPRLQHTPCFRTACPSRNALRETACSAALRCASVCRIRRGARLPADAFVHGRAGSLCLGLMPIRFGSQGRRMTCRGGCVRHAQDGAQIWAQHQRGGVG